MSHGYKITDLTADKLHRVHRNPAFSKVTEEDIKYFRSVLPTTSVLEKKTAPEDVYLKYTTDWYNVYRANPPVILFPENATQVSKILKYCNERHLAVVPQSGNTSAAGGSVPVYDEILISTHRMNKIRYFDEFRGDLICDAGCVLQDIDAYLSTYGYQMPLDLPARHLCAIGGNIATNAGGIRQMRFGNLHSTVMGLEVVLADGTILDNLSTLKKDNTGYHLKNLFIGSEGTLGFITGVSIMAAPFRKSVNVFLLGFDSFEDVVKAYALAKKELSETISAFEVFDKDCVRTVRQHNMQDPPNSPFPISDQHQIYVVLESAGTQPEFEATKAQAFLKLLVDQQIIQAGTLAKDPKEAAQLWSWRTKTPRAIVKNAPSSIHFDISLPLHKLYQLVLDAREWAQSEGLIPNELVGIFGYGHVGDGNLHLTIPAMHDDESLKERVDAFVYKWTAEYNGSVSAEHGIGLMKSPYLSYTKSSAMISTMRKIKDVFDPNGILNPYKVFPTDEELKKGEVIRTKKE